MKKNLSGIKIPIKVLFHSKIFLIMRLILILTCVFSLNIMAINSYAQNKKLDINAEGQTLREVLKIIENESLFRFFYNDEFTDLEKPVYLTAEKKSIEEILTLLLRNSAVTYKILDNSFVVLTPVINEQGFKVTGVVKDVTSGEPLAGVTVMVEGTSVGTITGADGRYTIEAPTARSVLVFSFIGYATQRIEINNRTEVNVEMLLDVRNLSEVVVIGYGSRQKKDVTGAISQISSAEITKRPVLNAQVAIQGQMPGVYVASVSSDPSARPTIRIRGVGTLGFNDPLYVIDGVPITEGYTGSDITSRQVTLRGDVNPLNMINPNDIESISVLKDASASAIYGLRASNGVILITTKRGARGAVKIDLTSQYGIQNFFKKYKAASISDYVAWSLEAFNNRLLTDPSYKKDQYFSFFDETNQQYLGNSQDYRKDWLKAALVENAVIQDHNLSVSGGNDISNYAVGAGYSTQDQATWYKKFTRYSTFANSDHKLTKWLKIGESIRLVYTYTERKPSGPGLDAEYTVPWQPFYDNTNTQGLLGLASYRLNGTVPSPFDPNYVNSLDGYALPGRYVNNYSVAGNPLQFYPYGYGSASRTNFLAQAPYSYDNTGMFRTLGGTYAEFTPVKGLRVRGTLNIDYYIQKQESFYMIERALFESNAGRLTTYASQGNTYTYRPRENLNIVKEFLAAYSKTLQKHSIDLLFNASDQRYYWTATSLGIGTYSPIPNWDQRRIEEGWKPEYKGSFYERERRGLLGYLGRFSYNFDNKYYLDLSVRRDGSSMFAPGYKWGTFPAFALAWRISRESFMSNLTWIDDLKLRGGWGKVGNQETRPYSYLSIVNLNPKAAFGTGTTVGDGILYDAAALSDFPVTDLTWEKVETTNIGFDATLLKNQVTLTAEYYYRFTDGILQTFQLARVVGALNNPKTNLAQVKNTGFEFQLGYNQKFGELGFNASFNLTTVKNEVVKLAYGQPITSGDYRIEEGYSMNYIYGYKTAGIYQTQQEVDDWKATTTDPGKDTHKSPGDIIFVDQYGDYITGVSPEGADKDYNPDGKINDRDRMYLGKTIPGYYYGITLNLDYKNFDLSMIFQGVGDVQKVNNRVLNSASGFGYNFDAAYKNRWTPDNPNTKIPRFVQGDPSGNNRTSDRMIQNAGFLRFQTFQLGYSLRGGILQKLGVSKLRYYIGGSNLFVISGYNDLDPEDNYLPTTFTTGINLSF